MSTISVKQALIYGINELRKAQISSVRLDSEILLGFVLGFNREKVIQNYELRIMNYGWEKYKRLIKKRAKHYPVAYILGSKEFYGIDFLVNENVLVPRPETETLVEEVIRFVGNRHACSLLEIGTGSGCIALTLAKYLPKAKITAVDISEKALKVARRNRARLKLKNVTLKKSDLLAGVKNKPDVLVANLPYLDNDLDSLIEDEDSKALRYEPQIALKGGPDGLDIYRKLFNQIKKKGWKDLVVFIEIGSDQTKRIGAFIKKTFPGAETEVKKDLAGHDRVIIARI